MDFFESHDGFQWEYRLLGTNVIPSNIFEQGMFLLLNPFPKFPSD